MERPPGPGRSLARSPLKPGPRTRAEARRGVRGYVRWIVREPGFELRVASVALVIVAGLAAGEAAERLIAGAVALAVLLPVTYAGWRRWWCKRG